MGILKRLLRAATPRYLFFFAALLKACNVVISFYGEAAVGKDFQTALRSGQPPPPPRPAQTS